MQKDTKMQPIDIPKIRINKETQKVAKATTHKLQLARC